MNIENKVKGDLKDTEEIYKNLEATIKKLKLNIDKKEKLLKQIIENTKRDEQPFAGRSGNINDTSNINFVRNLRS